MRVRRLFLCLAILAGTLFPSGINVSVIGQESAEPFQEIPRRIPPEGIELDAEQLDELATALDKLNAAAKRLNDQPHRADVECLLKAVEFSLELNEFYAAQDVEKAREILALAQTRIEQLEAGEAPWTTDTGRVVRGYISRVDGSPQPYGLEIPADLDRSKPVPLYVWLHGRGDKITDLHFIHQRLHRPGTIQVDDAIIVHPFGRHCIGFKSTGEIDVLEVVEQVQQHYRVDPDRIVLMGFSMGGAGVWHIGAHYPDRWVAMSPGAGFAETAKYNRLQPDDYPPTYEQTLWGVYDVPNYVRNLFNLPVIAYSGENDKQIQAARVMEDAFQEHGKSLTHVIGPGMGHRYHPDSLQQILEELHQVREIGNDRLPDRIWLQTRTLRYSRVHWIEVLGLDEHWQDTRVDAERSEAGISIATQNVSRFRIDGSGSIKRVTIDRQAVDLQSAQPSHTFAKDDQEQWRLDVSAPSGLVKRPGLQGPIDDAWLDAILVVKPSRASENERRQQWVEFELTHFEQRWKALFRGRLPVKLDSEVTAEDIANRHLILFGDPESNAVLRRIVDDLPLVWNAEQLRIGEQSFDASHHLPALIYPNPLNRDRYVVVNSGPTFREGHDRTNSLQNPKLPDWAIFDISVAPDEFSAGQVVAADFFDEHWQPKRTESD